MFRVSLISLLLLCSFSSYAENYDDYLDDLEDIEISNQATHSKSKASYLDKHFSGKVGTSFVVSDSSNRSSTAVVLRYEEELSNLKIVTEGAAVNSNLNIKQQLRSDQSGAELERTYSYSVSKVELQEGYATYNVADRLAVTYGQQKIVWGQFEPFSPVDFTLPIYFSRNYVAFNKVSNRVPMRSLNAAFNITPHIVLEGYYFTHLAYDDVVRDNIETGRNTYSKLESNGGGGHQFATAYKSIEEPVGSDKHQHAVRLMFYPSWATFGFTYFRGWDTNFPQDFDMITGFDDNGDDIYDAYYAEPNPALLRQETIGFEFAKKIGSKYTFMLEYSRMRAVNDLDYNSNDLESYSSLSGDKKTYYDKLLNDNQNKLYVEGHRHFGAMGLLYEGYKWDIQFATIFLGETYEDDGAAIQDLEEAAYPDDDDEFGGIFPALNITRYFDKEKKNMWGIVGGIVGPGGGVATYFKGQVRESVDWLVSLESVEYFADDIVETYNDLGLYENKNDRSNGIRFALSYSF